MQANLGIAPLTVIPPGTGAPGFIVTSGSGDAHGWWPGPLVMVGSDARSPANMMAAVEAVTDRTNWLGWRAIDWIGGGSYAPLFRGNVTIGNALAIDRSWASATSCLILEGSTAAGGWAADVTGGGTLGRAARLTGASGASSALDVFGGAAGATCDAITATGGATGGRAILATAGGGDSAAIVAFGSGGKAGLEATAGGTAGTAAILAHGGPVRIDTNIGSTSTDLGANCVWAEQTIKARCRINITASTGALTVQAGGVGIAAVALADADGFGNHAMIAVQLSHPMSNAFYDVIPSLYNIPSGTAAGRYPCTVDIVDNQNFAIWFMTSPTSGPQNINGTGAASVSFVVLGQQT